MLSFWERKEDARPDFPSIVTILSQYLMCTSDYLDLSTIKHDSNNTAISSAPKGINIEDDPEHSITHVPSNPNDYYVAGV